MIDWKITVDSCTTYLNSVMLFISEVTKVNKIQNPCLKAHRGRRQIFIHVTHQWSQNKRSVYSHFLSQEVCRVHFGVAVGDTVARKTVNKKIGIMMVP